MPQELSAIITIDVKSAKSSLDALASEVKKTATSVGSSFDNVSADKLAANIANGAKKAAAAANVLEKEVKDTTNSVSKDLGKAAVAAAAAGDKLETSLKKGAGSATQALTNLNRVVQDAPFGIVGIANNIDPLITSFQKLSKESGGVMGAIGTLGSSLIGPTGILFAFSALSSLATVMVQKYGSMSNAFDQLVNGTGELKKAQEELRQELDKSRAGVEGQIVQLEELVKIAKGDIGSKKDQAEALKQLNALIPDYIGYLTAQNIQTSEGEKILRAYTKALIDTAEAEILAKRAGELRISTRQKEKTLNKDIINELTTWAAASQAATSGMVGLAGQNVTGGNTMQQAFTPKMIQGTKAMKAFAAEYKELAEIQSRLDVLSLSKLQIDAQDVPKAKKKVEKIVNDIEKEFDAATVEASPNIIVTPGGVEIQDGLKKLNTMVQQEIDTTKALATFTIPAQVIIKPDRSVLAKSLQDLNKAINASINNFNLDAFSQIGEVIGQGIVNGTSGIQKAAAGLGMLIGDLFQQLGKAMIKYAIAAKAIQIALKSLSPVVALGAGVALVALGSVLKASLSNIGATAFANGGIINGPTLGMVGEAGQTEVILPLSKLNQFMDTTQGNGGVLEARVTGDQLLFLLNRAERRAGRLR
jgi:hypothetical protein